MDALFKRLYQFSRWTHQNSSWVNLLLASVWAILIAGSLLASNIMIRIILLLPMMTLTVLYVIMWAVVELSAWKQEFIIRQTDTLDRIRTLPWRDFESLVGAIYGHMGYEVEPRGGDQPDGGIDHVLHKDGQRVLIQCKCWRGLVGVKEVREVYGTLIADGAQKAIIVTSGSFSDDAKEFAMGKPIELVDGPVLYRILEGIRDHPERQTDPVKSILDNLLKRLELNDSHAVRRCPQCGASMIPKFNNREQVWFWGCSQFQVGTCKGSQSLSPAERMLVDVVRK